MSYIIIIRSLLSDYIILGAQDEHNIRASSFYNMVGCDTVRWDRALSTDRAILQKLSLQF